MGIGSFDSLSAIGNGVTILSMLLTVVAWILMTVFRKERIVAMAQPSMLTIMCIGSLMVLAGIQFYITISFPSEEQLVLDNTPWNVYCSIEFWLIWCGIFTILSILIFKLYRVYRITASRRGQRVLVRYFAAPFLLMVMSAIYANIGIQLVYKPEFTILETEIETNDGEIISIIATDQPHGDCYPTDSAGLTAVYIAKAIMEVPLEIAIVVFAFKLRDVSENIGESRRILRLALFNVSVYLLHWVIWSVLVQANVADLTMTIRVYMEGAMRIVAYNTHALSGPLYLIVPRIYYVWYKRKHGVLPVIIGSTNTNTNNSQNVSILPSQISVAVVAPNSFVEVVEEEKKEDNNDWEDSDEDSTEELSEAIAVDHNSTEEDSEAAYNTVDHPILN